MLNALPAPATSFSASSATQAPARNPAAPVASANDESAAEDFAQKLDHASAQPPRGTDTRPRDKLHGSSGNEPAKTDPVPRTSPAQIGGQSGQDGADGSTVPPESEDESHGAAADSAAPQGVAALLAQLRATAPAGGSAAGSGADGSDASDAGPALNRGAGRGRRADEARLMPGGAARRGDAGGDSEQEGGAESHRISFAQQLSEASAQDGSALRTDSLPTASNPLGNAAAAAAAAAAANATATATSPASAQRPAEAQLPATPGSAQFGAQLGAQISTFVRDGIEHARLHLNPAEMGPVSVQIQLDGQTALVRFSAENAHTRHALEQALPLLAGSLREAGLTLSGGGVFEQAHHGSGAQSGKDAGNAAGNSDTRSASDDAQGSLADDALHTHRSATPARRRGVVDLVA